MDESVKVEVKKLLLFSLSGVEGSGLPVSYERDTALEFKLVFCKDGEEGEGFQLMCAMGRSIVDAGMPTSYYLNLERYLMPIQIVESTNEVLHLAAKLEDVVALLNRSQFRVPGIAHPVADVVWSDEEGFRCNRCCAESFVERDFLAAATLFDCSTETGLNLVELGDFTSDSVLGVLAELERRSGLDEGV